LSMRSDDAATQHDRPITPTRQRKPKSAVLERTEAHGYAPLFTRDRLCQQPEGPGQTPRALVIDLLNPHARCDPRGAGQGCPRRDILE
jgi:hypothetical protein